MAGRGRGGCASRAIGPVARSVRAVAAWMGMAGHGRGVRTGRAIAGGARSDTESQRGPRRARRRGAALARPPPCCCAGPRACHCPCQALPCCPPASQPAPHLLTVKVPAHSLHQVRARLALRQPVDADVVDEAVGLRACRRVGVGRRGWSEGGGQVAGGGAMQAQGARRQHLESVHVHALLGHRGSSCRRAGRHCSALRLPLRIALSDISAFARGGFCTAKQQEGTAPGLHS